MSSTYGETVKISIFGESHGEGIGVVIDGLPAGEKIDFDKVLTQMGRRAPGKDKTATPRTESDLPKVLSGLLGDTLTGAPLCAVIENTNTRSGDYDNLMTCPRPAHADYTAYVKYHASNDVRGGGHFSGRLTAPLVFAGAVCRQLLEKQGIRIAAHIDRIGRVYDTRFHPLEIDGRLIDRLNLSSFALIDEGVEEAMRGEVEDARRNLDSIGADVEDYVQVLSLPLSDPLPQMEEIEISDSLFAAMPVQKKRVQRVLTHQQAQAEGLDEKHLRDVVYRPAWTFDTLSKTFEDWGLVRNDKDLVQFILTWKLFLQGIAEEMEEQHLQMDRSYRGHCVVMFAEDGYADYFLYNFLGDERPSEEQQRRFEQVMRTYIANNPLGYYGSRPFSQCGGFILQPHGIDSDEE